MEKKIIVEMTEEEYKKCQEILDEGILNKVPGKEEFQKYSNAIDKLVKSMSNTLDAFNMNFIKVIKRESGIIELRCLDKTKQQIYRSVSSDFHYTAQKRNYLPKQESSFNTFNFIEVGDDKQRIIEIATLFKKIVEHLAKIYKTV